MICRKPFALLLIAVLLCNAALCHRSFQALKQGKKQSLESIDASKELTIPPKIFIQNKAAKNRMGSNKCVSVHTVTGNCQSKTTTFHDTWETLGNCSRYYQTVKQICTTVDTIKCQSETVDTLTNEKVCWKVLSTRHQPEKVIKQIHQKIEVLKPVKKHFQRLVPMTVTFETVENQKVCVQTITETTATIGKLTTKHESQRVIKTQRVCARTLEKEQACIKKVKKVNEQVSESISESIKCIGTRNGESIKSKSKSCFIGKSCSGK